VPFKLLASVRPWRVAKRFEFADDTR
jgi:hypothetical protein